MLDAPDRSKVHALRGRDRPVFVGLNAPQRLDPAKGLIGVPSGTTPLEAQTDTRQSAGVDTAGDRANPRGLRFCSKVEFFVRP
jgi:hypothetical protein